MLQMLMDLMQRWLMSQTLLLLQPLKSSHRMPSLNPSPIQKPMSQMHFRFHWKQKQVGQILQRVSLRILMSRKRMAMLTWTESPERFQKYCCYCCRTGQPLPRTNQDEDRPAPSLEDIAHHVASLRVRVMYEGWIVLGRWSIRLG